MKIVRKTAPYLRRPQATVTRMMRDVFIALVPVTLFAIFQFGLDAFWIILVSMASMAITEYVYYQVMDLKDGQEFKIKNKSFSLHNFSALTSGLIFALILPDQISLMAVAASGALGIFIGKLIFGGLGQNIFNPAAVARVLVLVNFVAFTAYSPVDSTTGATALGDLALSPFALPDVPLWRLFSGIGLPGSLGEVSSLLLLLGGVYLYIRTSFEVRIPLMYIGTVFVLAFVSALYVGVNPLEYGLFHIFSGSLMFGAIYMATDPVTSPITKPGRMLFGMMLGVVTYFIRVFGAYPEGVIFSILLMNMFVPIFDHPKLSKSMFIKRRLYITVVVFMVIIGITLLGVHYAI
jgi:electron transport complex protein RnfD